MNLAKHTGSSPGYSLLGDVGGCRWVKLSFSDSKSINIDRPDLLYYRAWCGVQLPIFLLVAWICPKLTRLILRDESELWMNMPEGRDNSKLSLVRLR